MCVLLQHEQPRTGHRDADRGGRRRNDREPGQPAEGAQHRVLPPDDETGKAGRIEGRPPLDAHPNPRDRRARSP